VKELPIVSYTCAKIPIIVFALDACTTWRRVSEEDGDSFLGSRGEKVSLLSAE
jgi:hypothetical protein